jgi:Protein of unknown function (DUF3892)
MVVERKKQMIYYFYAREPSDRYCVTTSLEDLDIGSTSEADLVNMLSGNTGLVVAYDPKKKNLALAKPVASVLVVVREGRVYLRSSSDGALNNNLEKLPSEDEFMKVWDAKGRFTTRVTDDD